MLLMNRKFGLKRRVDEIIRNAFEGGLFVKWNRDSQRKKEHLIPFEPKPQLTLTEYGFFLIMCGIGWFCSILAFLVELFIQRKLKQNSKSRFWIFSQRLVDSRRYYFKNIPEKLMASNLNRNLVAIDNFNHYKRLKIRHM